MITKDVALSIRIGKTLYSRLHKHPNGRAIQATVIGPCKQSTMRPNEFSLPVRMPLGVGVITQDDACNWAMFDPTRPN